MRLILSLLITLSSLFANIATVVDSVGDSTLQRAGKTIKVVPKLQLKEHDHITTGKNAKVKIFFQDSTAVSLGKNTSFKIDSYLYTGKKDSNARFNVVKGFFKTVTGKISKIAPNKFKLKTKTATIGIRGTVFSAEVGGRFDVVMCTDGTIVLFTKAGAVEVNAGSLGRVKKGARPKLRKYTQKEKEALLEKAGWNGSMTLKELIAFIKKNFKEPLRSQLLLTLQNILDKDSDERERYAPKVKVTNADDIGFVDEITINDRGLDSLEQREIEFYLEDLIDGKVIIQGLLESEDDKVSVKELFVEITTDGGKTWSRAKGHDEWEWSFKPELETNYEFSLRVVKQSKYVRYAPLKIGGISKSAFKVDAYTSPSKLQKAKTFTPKVITTQSIVIKFKKFTPKVITTQPIIIKFKEVSQEN